MTSLSRDTVISLKSPIPLRGNDAIRTADVNRGAGIIFYGERPITSLCAMLITPEDVKYITEEIVFENDVGTDAPITYPSESHSARIFIEAPLGKKYGTVDLIIAYDDLCIAIEVKPQGYERVSKRLAPQIRRYVDAVLDTETIPSTPLAKEIRSILASRKCCLVFMTRDEEPPTELFKILRNTVVKQNLRIGWLPYSCLENLLHEHGCELGGDPPHFWAYRGADHSQ